MPNSKKPIYVSNPNDSRIKAYADSLDAFAFNKKSLDKVFKTGKSIFGSPVDVSKKKYLTRDQDINEKYNRYKSLGLNITKQDVINESDSMDFIKGQKINKKVGSYNFPIKSGGIYTLAQYKKPEQPYVYKKEERKKENIEPLEIKQTKLNVFKDTIVDKKPEPIVPKKLPGGSGPFARYPNMKSKLGSMKTSRMVNGRNVENISATGPSFVSGAKSVKQYRGDENLPEAKKGMKNCGCKHPKSKYKYGTGALTIPEGSAIVTANGGKNKQALMAYKKGNYKLLNSIIEDMPEDKVSKKQDGSYDLYSDERIAEKFGQKYDVDKAKYRSSIRGNKLNVVEDKNNKKYRDRLRSEPDFLKSEMKEGRAVIDKNGNITYKPIGASSKNKMEFLGTFKPKEEIAPLETKTPEIQTSEITERTPTPITQNNTDKNNTNTNKRKGSFLQNIPSLAEAAAKTSLLAQGVEGVPENYLTLGRYNYASQLPKTLQEIQLAEQAGRETTRDMVAGDAGRYLAQAGNLSAARMKAANEAVIQDTLARQDILNKNVDLGNVEAETNRSLKDQYALQRSANRGAYNNMLVSLGQSIDTASDASKLMSSQRENDAQRIELLKTMGNSGNYDVVTNPDGTITYKAKQLPTSTPVKSNARGSKKLKTYKRK